MSTPMHRTTLHTIGRGPIHVSPSNHSARRASVLAWARSRQPTAARRPESEPARLFLQRRVRSPEQ